jgi:hypothetical protein
MAGQLSDRDREVRDTVLKSSFTGVAATVIAVTAFSPAGFGDWIGASLASNLRVGASANAADNPYVDLPPFLAPLTQAELNDIRSQLAAAEASLSLSRSTTDTNIERVRALALTDGVVSFTPTRRVAPPGPDIAVRMAYNQSVSYEEAPVESYVSAAPVEARVTPVSYAGAPNYEGSLAERDPNLELAELLLAHERF